jgi:hypothetical protein
MTTAGETKAPLPISRTHHGKLDVSPQRIRDDPIHAAFVSLKTQPCFISHQPAGATESADTRFKHFTLA